MIKYDSASAFYYIVGSCIGGIILIGLLIYLFSGKIYEGFLWIKGSCERRKKELDKLESQRELEKLKTLRE